MTITAPKPAVAAAVARLSASDLARLTPDSRDRAVDLLRAASIAVVVLGHWLMAVVAWSQGEFRTGNVLGMVPGLWAATWVLQVMPVFFFVGGFSNLVTLDACARRGTTGVEFVRDRAQRLLRPVAILLGIWLPLAAVLGVAGVPASVLGPATRLVCQPLWFIGVYLIVTALAPTMLRAHRRFGVQVPLVLAAGAAAVDLARFGAGLATAGYLNVAFVWLLAQQLGFFYADGRLASLSRRALVLVAAASFVALALLTTFGPYPSSMVGLPGERVSNMSPPSFCLVALTCLQVSLVMLARPALNRWLRRNRPWAAVVALNGVIMTVFCWHLTALLAGVALLYPLGFPQPAGGTAAWWATRPLWIGALLVLLALLVAALGRLERPREPAAQPTRSEGPLPRAALVATAGTILLVVGVVGFAMSDLAGLADTGGARLIVLRVSPFRSLAATFAGWWLLGLAARPDARSRLAASHAGAAITALGAAAALAGPGSGPLTAGSAEAVVLIATGALLLAARGSSAPALDRPNPDCSSTPASPVPGTTKEAVR